VIIITLVMLVIPMATVVRPAAVIIRSVIRATSIIAVIAAWVIAVSRISVIAIPI